MLVNATEIMSYNSSVRHYWIAEINLFQMYNVNNGIIKSHLLFKSLHFPSA